MVIVNGLVALVLLPFVVLAIGVWMSWLLVKAAVVGIVALGCLTVGLFRAIAGGQRRVRSLREE